MNALDAAPHRSKIPSNSQSMNPPPHAEPLPPRPASHRWVIALFGFMTFGFALVLLRAFLDRSLDEFLRLPVLVASIIGIIVAFFSICLGRRHRWVYYLASSVLIFFAARSIQAVCLFGSFWLSPPPGKTPFPF